MIYTLVNCTNSKTVLPSPQLEMSNYSHLPMEEALLAWKKAIQNEEPQYTAETLYKGPYWNHVKEIHKNATLEIDYLVVSAGLGLIKRNELIPSYASTFTSQVKDSIPKASTPNQSSQWWEGLGGSERFRHIMCSDPNPLVISVLSLEYLYATQSALSWFIDTYGTERLLILCSKNYKQKFPTFCTSWVELDSKLLTIFGGKMGDLNIRALGWIMNKITNPEELTKEKIQKKLSIFEESFLHLDPINKPGKKQTEQDVRIWIKNALDSPSPPTSKTAALRLFRKEGFGFAKNRFEKIFIELYSKQHK